MDYKVISADDHIDLGYLPRDLWTEGLPEALKDRAPYVEDREKGEFWVCDGESWGDYRGERWFKSERPLRLALDRGGVAEAGRPTNPEKRMVDMDRDGVEASVMFPPILPFQVNDPELRNAVVSTYNEWAAQFKAAGKGRFIPIGILSPLDPKAAADEVRHIRKLGLQQANFLVNDVTTDLYQPHWDVFWDTAQETECIVSYHVGGSPQLGSFQNRANQTPPKGGRPMVFGMGLGNGATSFFEPFVNLFTFGTLERHPNLRFVCGESAIGWIPFVVQEMDFRYKRLFETKSAGDIPLKEMPGDVFRRQVYATYQADYVGLHLVPFFGDGHVMWASDYPHPDSTWPFSQDVIQRETGHLDPETKRKVLHDNAARLYGLN